MPDLLTRCVGRITSRIYAYTEGGKGPLVVWRRPGDRCMLPATVGRYCWRHAE